jgi:hypothetical protein
MVVRHYTEPPHSLPRFGRPYGWGKIPPPKNSRYNVPITAAIDAQPASRAARLPAEWPYVSLIALKSAFDVPDGQPCRYRADLGRTIPTLAARPMKCRGTSLPG